MRLSIGAGGGGFVDYLIKVDKVPVDYPHNADIIIGMNADDLKAALAQLGWSQKYFSERYGCDHDTVNRWCTGKVPVPGHVVEYLRVIKLAKEILG